MKKTTTKKASHAGAIVSGLLGVTAAAVGTYFLYGHKDAAKNRAKVKGWMLKAKGEVLEKLEKIDDVTEGAYHSTLDAVIEKYNKVKNIDPAELEGFVKQMKAHWGGIKKSFKKAPAKKK